MTDIAKLFEGGSLTYEKFSKKIAECGVELGDVAEVRRGYEDRITQMRCTNALEREMERAGAINTALVSKLIDLDKITADDEGVHGIGEQIASLRESDPYLFVPEKKTTLRALMTGARHSTESADHDKMSDADYYKSVKLI